MRNLEKLNKEEKIEYLLECECDHFLYQYGSQCEQSGYLLSYTKEYLENIIDLFEDIDNDIKELVTATDNYEKELLKNSIMINKNLIESLFKNIQEEEIDNIDNYLFDYISPLAGNGYIGFEVYDEDGEYELCHGDEGFKKAADIRIKSMVDFATDELKYITKYITKYIEEEFNKISNIYNIDEFKNNTMLNMKIEILEFNKSFTDDEKTEVKLALKKINQFCNKYKLAEISNITDAWPTKDITSNFYELYSKYSGYGGGFHEYNPFSRLGSGYDLISDNHSFYEKYLNKNKSEAEDDDEIKYIEESKRYMNNYNKKWDVDFIKSYKEDDFEITRYKAV